MSTAFAFGVKLAAEEENKEESSATSGDERKRRAKNRAEDLVPMKGFGRGYADYLLPSTFGGTRAGRAAMIAKALGQKPDFSVSHPNTDSVLSSLGGGLVGGLGGAALGGLGGALTGNLDNAAIGAMLGAGVGNVGGTVLGIAGSGMQRREQMQNIQNDLAKELEQHGTSRLNLETPQYSALSSILQPLSGAHRAGQADAYEALKNNTRYSKTPNRTGGYIAAHIPYVGPLINMGQGIGQNFSARKRMKQEASPIEDPYGLNEFGPAKAASAFEFGAKVANAVLEGGLGGATLGAGLGGLAGALMPGVDPETGKRKSRLMAALRGALGGGAVGGAGGAALGHFAPDAMTRMQQFYNRNTPMPTREVAQARATMQNYGEEPGTDPLLGDNPAMAAARR